MRSSVSRYAPVPGAAVVHFEDREKKSLGRVIRSNGEMPIKLQIHWFARQATEWVGLSELRRLACPIRAR